MLAEGTPWTFCQNNTMMLTYTHNHALGILLWQCSCHRNEKQNSEPFFNYDANLTSVITMELKVIMLVSLCDVIICDASSMLKTFVKFWGTFFRFWLCPCLQFINLFFYFIYIFAIYILSSFFLCLCYVFVHFFNFLISSELITK